MWMYAIIIGPECDRVQSTPANWSEKYYFSLPELLVAFIIYCMDLFEWIERVVEF